MATVADVLKRIERLKKDLEYVRSFQEKWRDQRDRFPKIYEGILEQEQAFLQKIDELRNLGVNAAEDLIKSSEPSGAFPAVVAEEPKAPLMAPNIEGNGRRRREGSDDGRQAAAEGITEKLRQRQAAATPSSPS